MNNGTLDEAYAVEELNHKGSFARIMLAELLNRARHADCLFAKASAAGDGRMCSETKALGSVCIALFSACQDALWAKELLLRFGTLEGVDPYAD